MFQHSINSALRIIRKGNNCTLQDLSCKVNLNQVYLSEIEEGKKDPSIELINKYTELFNIDKTLINIFRSDLKKQSIKIFFAKTLMRMMLSIEKSCKYYGNL